MKQTNEERKQLCLKQQDEIKRLRESSERIMVLAIKHCPRTHHDYQEVLKLTEVLEVK